MQPICLPTPTHLLVCQVLVHLLLRLLQRAARPLHVPVCWGIAEEQDSHPSSASIRSGQAMKRFKLTNHVVSESDRLTSPPWRRASRPTGPCSCRPTAAARSGTASPTRRWTGPQRSAARRNARPPAMLKWSQFSMRTVYVRDGRAVCRHCHTTHPCICSFCMRFWSWHDTHVPWALDEQMRPPRRPAARL